MFNNKRHTSEWTMWGWETNNKNDYIVSLCHMSSSVCVCCAKAWIKPHGFQVNNIGASRKNNQQYQPYTKQKQWRKNCRRESGGDGEQEIDGKPASTYIWSGAVIFGVLFAFSTTQRSQFCSSTFISEGSWRKLLVLTVRVSMLGGLLGISTQIATEQNFRHFVNTWPLKQSVGNFETLTVSLKRSNFQKDLCSGLAQYADACMPLNELILCAFNIPQ